MPASATAGTPRAMEHMGAANTLLDHAVRTAAVPAPFAGPRDLIAAGDPPPPPPALGTLLKSYLGGLHFT